MGARKFVPLPKGCDVQEYVDRGWPELAASVAIKYEVER